MYVPTEGIWLAPNDKLYMRRKRPGFLLEKSGTLVYTPDDAHAGMDYVHTGTWDGLGTTSASSGLAGVGALPLCTI